jgi:hypothetical protein
MGNKGDLFEENKKGEYDIDYSKLDHLFIVMDLGETDLRYLMNKQPPIKIEEDHIITILYN